MQNSWLALALLLGSASCFSPSLAGVTVTCDPPLIGACPNGLQCNSQGICGGGDSEGDGSTGSTVDLATPTPPVTLEPADGCPLSGAAIGQGYLVSSGSKKVWACPIRYGNGGGLMPANRQCKSPYTLCTQANNIDLAKCNKAGATSGGFFIADVKVGRKSEPEPATCGQANGSNAQVLWAGCGRTAATITGGRCAEFTSAIDCNSATLPSVRCVNTNIDGVSGDLPNGVLCCN